MNHQYPWCKILEEQKTLMANPITSQFTRTCPIWGERWMHLEWIRTVGGGPDGWGDMIVASARPSLLAPTTSTTIIFRCKSISSTNPFVRLLVILSHFHSVSVYEPSQSVATTLWWQKWWQKWWLTWLPTWWSTWRVKKIGWHGVGHVGHHIVVSMLCEGSETLTEWKSESGHMKDWLGKVLETLACLKMLIPLVTICCLFWLSMHCQINVLGVASKVLLSTTCSD